MENKHNHYHHIYLLAASIEAEMDIKCLLVHWLEKQALKPTSCASKVLIVGALRQAHPKGKPFNHQI